MLTKYTALGDSQILNIQFNIHLALGTNSSTSCILFGIHHIIDSTFARIVEHYFPLYSCYFLKYINVTKPTVIDEGRSIWTLSNKATVFPKIVNCSFCNTHFFPRTSRWMCLSVVPVDFIFCLCFVYPLHWSIAFCTFICKSFVNKRNNPLSFLISKQKFDKWAFYCFDCGAKTVMIICGGCAGGMKHFHHERQIIFHLCMHLSLGHVANRWYNGSPVSHV